MTSSSKRYKKDINSIYTHSQKDKTIQNKKRREKIDTKINKENQKDITMINQGMTKTKGKTIVLKMNKLKNINKIK